MTAAIQAVGIAAGAPFRLGLHRDVRMALIARDLRQGLWRQHSKGRHISNGQSSSAGLLRTEIRFAFRRISHARPTSSSRHELSASLGCARSRRLQ